MSRAGKVESQVEYLEGGGLMPNEFSVEIHNYLKDKILAAEKAAKHDDQNISAYAQGQLEELQWIRKYLQENIDLKNFVYY